MNLSFPNSPLPSISFPARCLPTEISWHSGAVSARSPHGIMPMHGGGNYGLPKMRQRANTSEYAIPCIGLIFLIAWYACISLPQMPMPLCRNSASDPAPSYLWPRVSASQQRYKTIATAQTAGNLLLMLWRRLPDFLPLPAFVHHGTRLSIS